MLLCVCDVKVSSNTEKTKSLKRYLYRWFHISIYAAMHSKVDFSKQSNMLSSKSDN